MSLHVDICDGKRSRPTPENVKISTGVLASIYSRSQN